MLEIKLSYLIFSDLILFNGVTPSAYEIDFNNMYTSLKEDIKQSTQDQIAFLAKQISGQIQEIKNQQPYMQRYAMPQATHAIQQSIPTYQIQQQ